MPDNRLTRYAFSATRRDDDFDEEAWVKEQIRKARRFRAALADGSLRSATRATKSAVGLPPWWGERGLK
jgi:hypothetical protein